MFGIIIFQLLHLIDIFLFLKSKLIMDVKAWMILVMHALMPRNVVWILQKTNDHSCIISSPIFSLYRHITSYRQTAHFYRWYSQNLLGVLFWTNYPHPPAPIDFQRVLIVPPAYGSPHRLCTPPISLLFYILTHFPANMRRWNNAVQMLDQRRRRWPSIETALCRCIMLNGSVFTVI